MFPWLGLLYFLLAYAAALCLLVFLNDREFANEPEKLRRYTALPLRYKNACRFVVLPFVGMRNHSRRFFSDRNYLCLSPRKCMRALVSRVRQLSA